MNLRTALLCIHLTTRARLCFALCWWLMSSPVAPQTRVDSWTTDDGLPQNTVNAILQTPDGYLWLATLDGLVRYDGVHFKVFDKGNTRGIESNRVMVLYAERDGTLWAGTEDGRLIRCRGQNCATFVPPESLLPNTVTAIRRDAQGSPLVSTTRGLMRLADEQLMPVEVDGALSRCYLGQTGALWTFREGHARRFKDGAATDYEMPFVGTTVTFENRQGALWMAKANAQLFKLQDGKITTYIIDSLLPSQEVRTIYEDRQGVLWLGASDGRLLRFENGSFAPLTVGDDFHGTSISSFYEDQEGTFWAGTFTRGLSRLSQKAITVYSSKDGLRGDQVNAIYEDHKGNLWIAANELNRYKDGKPVGYTTRDGLRVTGVRSMLEDREGRLWLGTAGRLWWLQDDRLHDFSDRLGLRVGDFSVWAIHQDGEGTLWFATDKGLIKYRDDQVTLLTTRDGLPSEDVRAIHEDNGGNLWFATYGGLACLKQGRFVSLTEKDGLSSNRVRAVHEDRDGVLWIGTYDGGLNRLKDHRLTRYTTAEGLTSNGVFQILEDNRGNFWMSSNVGIYRASRQELNDFAEGKTKTINCVSYGQRDGLLNAECNGGSQPAGIRASDGRLWFPTQQGVAVIDPEAAPVNHQPPPVVIESCRLDRVPVAFDHQIEVAPRQENLEIDYAGLSFIKPEHLRFKYRLEGLDGDWVDAGSRRTAYYAHLPPGRYTFHVIAANSDGIWNSEGASLRVVVLPAFWQTWWFRVLAVTAVAVLALLVYDRRVSQLRRANAQQQAFSRQLIESQERERKRIAAELHDSLGQRLVVIKNLALMVLHQAKPDDGLNRQVDEISSEASQAIGEVKEISYNLRPYQLDRLGLTKAVEAIINKAEMATPIHLSPFIDDIDGALSKEDEINFYRIVQESVNNMVKHANATEARLTIERAGQTILLTIQDNGQGFAPTGDGHLLSGFGLVGIGERVRILGGTHTIHSTPGEGTTISVKIPLKGNKNE